jgi:class 3 adenylate cyclase
VFRLASDPIDEHDGDVYQYVGDRVYAVTAKPSLNAGKTI